MADRDQSGRPPPLPSGYDYDFVTELDEDFVCQICQLPLRNAVLTRCGHRFCHDCLNEHFKRIQHPNCPLDRTRLDKDKDIFPDKASERRILSYFVKCPNRCQWEGELRDVENHQQICPYMLVQCPNSNCHVYLARNLIEEHVAVSCRWRIVSCQFCPEKYPKAEEDIHNETCPKFPLNCSNGCEQVVPREQMLKHLETECRLTPVSCPFHDLGCNMKVERRNLETHVREDTTTHLSFACKKLALLQQEFDEEKKTLKKQLDDLKKENNNLLLKVSAQEKEMHKSQMETPMFVWKITGFGDILHQAKVGRNNKIDSDPFYTGKYGYKLKLSVNPNGDGSGRNTHLSAFVIVMRGEHDAILPWPFNQKVTFTLIDQQESLDERQNVTMLFRANTKLENFARPTAEENPGRGYARFMSHEKLKTRRYLVDDTLFIQVDVGPPSL